MRTVLVVLMFSMIASTAQAAVFCAKPRRAGTFNSTVKVREACLPREVQLDPGGVGFCCGTTTVTTTTLATPTTMGSSTTMVISTTSSSTVTGPVLSTTSTTGCFTNTTGTLPQYLPCSTNN